MSTKLIVGCGYLGLRVARRWLAGGHRVIATVRAADRAAQIAAEGIEPRIADVTRRETLLGLPTAETVLYAVGYDRRGSASRWQVQVDGLRSVLDALPDQTGRIVYISSTGVYGETEGAWVDESTPCRPLREAGRALLAAEDVLARHPLASRSIVLRLAGLYGPDRLPKIADLRAGRPLAVSGRGRLNLIHVEDATGVVLAAAERANPPRTYVVSDGTPVGRREFYRHLASRLGLPAPTFVEPSPEDLAAQRGGGDKRASNARMLAELGVKLVYPSYREGLGDGQDCPSYDRDKS